MVDENKIDIKDDQDDWSTWDDDDYDFNYDEEPKDDRKPITRGVVGALKGFGKDLISTDRLHQIAKNALPKGYGDALDMAGNFRSSTRELYNEAVKDIVPTVNEGKRVINKLAIKYRDKLPDYAQKISDKWEAQIKEEDESAARDRDWQQRMGNHEENELNRQVTEALGQIANQNADEQADRQARDAISSDIQDKRYNAQYKQIGDIQKGISQLVGFQHDYAARYMRKSLELQYRSIAVQKAHLTSFQKALEIQTPIFQGIQKNTGLPDFVKNTGSELLKRQLFERLFGRGAAMFKGDFENQFFSNAVKNVKNGIVRNVQDTVNSVRNGFAMGDMAAGMTDGMGDMISPGDTAEMAGEGAGATIAAIVVPWLASKAGAQMQKIAREHPDSRVGRAVKVINDKGENAAYYVRNIGKLMQQDIAENLYSYDSGFIKSSLRKAGSSIFTMDYGRNTSVQNLRAEDLSEPMTLDRLMHRSVTEVMPALLTEINRNVEAIRTGEDDPDSKRYDHLTGRMVSSKTRLDNVKDTLFNRRQFHEYTKGFENVFKVLDADKKLSGDARNAIQKQMVRDSDANIAFDPMRFMEQKTYRGGIDKDVLKEITNFLKDRYDINDVTRDDGTSERQIGNRDQFYRERNRADILYGNQKSYQPDIQTNLNLLKGTGDADLLVKLGILKANSDGSYTVVHDRIEQEYDKYIDNDDYVRRAFADTEVQRGATRQSQGPSVKVSPRNDRRNTKALNRLSEEIQRLNQRPDTPSLEPQIPPAVRDTGYGKWWNDHGVITGSLEAQNRSWQEVQLEAQEEARQQRNSMLEIMHDIGVILTDTAERASRTSGDTERPFDGSFGGRLKRLAMHQIGGLREGAGILNHGIVQGGGLVKRLAQRVLPVAWDATKSLSELAFKGMRGTVDTQWSAVKGTVGLFNRPTDVYVKGERRPRLLAAKLKQGLYIDKNSGKTIFKVKDIKGPVDDLDGNAVITEEDFELGLTNRWGKSIRASKLSTLIGRGRDAVSRMYGNLLNGPAQIKRAAVAVYRQLDKPVDIFVSGEEHPRLLSMVMLNGGYFRANDGKVIHHYDDINGDIVDSMGETVLTLADMRKGLVDKNGQPIRRMKEKLFDLGKQAVMLPLTLLRKGKELASKVGRGIANKLKRLGDWWNDPSGLMVGQTSLMVDKLNDIYNLLNERLAGKKDYRDSTGDGIRDGSLEDLRKKREDKETEGEQKEEKKSDKKKGALGALGDMLGGTSLGKKLMNSPLGKLLGGIGTMLGGGMNMLSGGATVAGVLGKGMISAGRIIGGGAISAVGTIWGAIGGLSGLSAMLFNPVTWGILAGGAAIWGAWKLYKHFADKPDPMQKLRLIAYGARGDDSDFNEKLLKTEYYMVEHVSVTADGNISFDRKVSAEEVMKIWEIDPKDSDRLSEWLRWYRDRFTPVFARAWKLFGSTLPESKKYMEMDKDPDGLAKIKWSEMFIWPSDSPQSPYYCEANPLGTTGDTLYIAGQGVGVALQAQLEVIKKDYKKDVKKYTHDEAMLKWSKLSEEQRKQITPYALEHQKASASFSHNQYSLASGSKKAEMNVTVVIEKTDRRGKNWMIGGKIDELTALRLRCYGLGVPTLSQVKAILKLESLVGVTTQVSGDKATFSGNLFEIYQQVAPSFGRAADNQNDYRIWSNWANNRFFPVFLSMAVTCSKEGGKGLVEEVLPDLNDQVRYDLALELVEAQYKDDGVLKPIWDWEGCGFRGIVPNKDSATTQPALEALKKLADAYKIYEKKLREEGSENEAAKKQQQQMMASAGYEFKDGRWEKKWNTATKGTGSGNNDPSMGRRNPVGTQYFSRRGDDPTGLGGNTGVQDYSGLDSTGLMKPAKGPGAEKGRKQLVRSAVKNGITNPMEMAMLLANAEHESGDYAHVREGIYKSPQRLLEVFPKYFKTLADAQAAINAGPAAVFERVYGGRMGNNERGDGGKYPGRGYMQITGKDNYKRVGHAINKDLVNNPEYAETPEGAADVSVGWWKLQGNRISQPAQQGDVDSVRKVVNGGANGIQDVRRRSGYWMQQAKTGELAKMIKDAANSSDKEIDAPESGSDVQQENQQPPTPQDAQQPSQTAATQAPPAASPETGAPVNASYPGKAGSAAPPQRPQSEPVATPAPETRRSDPGAGRGYSPASNPDQVNQMVQQTSKAGDAFYGEATGILKAQLEEQKKIAVSTEKMALSMETLISAVNGLKQQSGQSPTSPGTQAVPSKPSGAQPMRNRYN